MIAIVMAAVIGAGLSTLVLAKFGVSIALLAVPLVGSASGMAAALGVAAARDRQTRDRLGEASAQARAFAIAKSRP